MSNRTDSLANGANRLWARTAAIVAVAGLAGCPTLRPKIELDLSPPYLLGVEPSGNAVPIDATFEIQLSERVREQETKLAGWWVEAERLADLRIKAANAEVDVM